MPARPAYPVADVVAVGRSLASRGELSPRTLHEALGRKGLERTVWRTWCEHGPTDAEIVDPVGDASQLPALAQPFFAAAVQAVVDMGLRIHADCEARLERAGGQALKDRDDLMAERDMLGQKVSGLMAQIGRLEGVVDAQMAEIERLSAELVAARAPATRMFDAEGRLVAPLRNGPVWGR
jgi:hypothetical protein